VQRQLKPTVRCGTALKAMHTDKVGKPSFHPIPRNLSQCDETMSKIYRMISPTETSQVLNIGNVQVHTKSCDVSVERIRCHLRVIESECDGGCQLHLFMWKGILHMDVSALSRPLIPFQSNLT